MAEPLSNGAAYHSVPEPYKLPVHKRPGARSLPSSSSVSGAAAAALPVIDLSGDDGGKIAKQIVDAGKEFGFFKVINHGVPDEVMRDMMSAAEEFFGLPAMEKMAYYSTDSRKLPRFHTSVGKDDEEVLYWRDCLKLGCYPFEQFRHQWPQKPRRLSEALEAYTAAVRAVAMRVLRLVAAGLGLGEGYLEGKLSGGPVMMNVNHYLPCPDPSLTLGLAPHCDPNLVTVLMDNGVGGLQVLHGGDWVEVEAAPGAFVVNFGHQMEVISNGTLRSVQHRALTNASAARTSLAMFVMPEMDCIVAPAPELLGDGKLGPQYRPCSYGEFVGVYTSVNGDRDAVLANLKQ